MPRPSNRITALTLLGVSCSWPSRRTDSSRQSAPTSPLDGAAAGRCVPMASRTPTTTASTATPIAIGSTQRRHGQDGIDQRRPGSGGAFTVGLTSWPGRSVVRSGRRLLGVGGLADDDAGPRADVDALVVGQLAPLLRRQLIVGERAGRADVGAVRRAEVLHRPALAGQAQL